MTATAETGVSEWVAVGSMLATWVAARRARKQLDSWITRDVVVSLALHCVFLDELDIGKEPGPWQPQGLVATKPIIWERLPVDHYVSALVVQSERSAYRVVATARATISRISLHGTVSKQSVLPKVASSRTTA